MSTHVPFAAHTSPMAQSVSSVHSVPIISSTPPPIHIVTYEPVRNWTVQILEAWNGATRPVRTCLAQIAVGAGAAWDDLNNVQRVSTEGALALQVERTAT